MMLAFVSAQSPSQWDLQSRPPAQRAARAGSQLGPGPRGTPASACGGYLSLALAALAAPRLSRGRARASRVIRLAEVDPTSYVPILVEIEGDKAYQIEVRPSDTAKIVKAVLNLELGISEYLMEVSYDGKPLDDDLVLTEIDLKEGSKIQVKVLEADEVEEPEPNPEDATGLRIFIKVDGPGKATKLTLDVDPQENVGDLKLEAYEQFREKVPFLCDLAARQYGLFLLDGTPTADSRGNLRYLKKSERLNEKQTIEENGLEGGEELVFGSLAWMELL